jgi:hypothetical protein
MMMPFSTKKQAQIIRQENQITDVQWEKSRDIIMAEHRLSNAREQLEQHWKAWIGRMLSRLAGRRQPVLRPQLRRFRSTTRINVLLYHLLLCIQHVPIDTLDVLAKRDSVPSGGEQNSDRFF